MRTIYFILFCFFTNFSFAQQTRFEKTNGTETANYFETISFYKMLDKSADNILMKEGAMSDAGYPLHIVLVSADKSFIPAEWHKKNKVVIMINNGIHPGEPDGIDASMMLLRDIKNRKIILPDNVVLAVIPVYNIGGCLNRNSVTRVNQNGPLEYGFRGNSQNLDLNRDFTKNDSKESKAFAKLFHWLNPDIFIDNHVSDGADYQHTMTLITTQYEKLGATAGNWLRNIFEPQIYAGMKEKNWDLIPYVEFDGADFNKGINMFYETPRYSSGYAALFGTFSFIPETHMLKPYKDRVLSTYDLMETFIKKAAASANELLAIRKKAAAEMLVQKQFPLKWNIDKSKNSSIVFKGYEQDSTNSEATSLPKMFYNRNKPYSKEVKFFNYFKPENIIEKPKAYIIPAGWYDVVQRLELNGVKLRRIIEDTNIQISFYKIDEHKSRPTPYEKHHGNYAVKTTKFSENTKILKGDYIVELNQPGNRYIVEMLEPTGDDSFFAWNFFDAILQQKEGYSDYRWEDIAIEVLKKDATLQQKLATKKIDEPAFAKNGPAILNYIYKNSVYYEKAHMRYPIYRIE
ncbi:MAG: M14 family metallopeptidase [Ferruginibacter sp.]|nr:M14 family metallopeptidase [Ferruginibacter sp.]